MPLKQRGPQGQAEGLKQSMLPHVGEAEMAETHAPFWRQQEETAGQHYREISRLLPPIHVRRALGKDFMQHASCQKW